MGRSWYDMTPEIKKNNCRLSRTGYSGHKISKFTRGNPRTINTYLKRIEERGNEENIPWTGSRLKLTAELFVDLGGQKKNRSYH